MCLARGLCCLPHVCCPLYEEFIQMPVKGMSGVCGPVPVTRTGAGGAYDCFLTERDSLDDLISSFCENRKA